MRKQLRNIAWIATALVVGFIGLAWSQLMPVPSNIWTAGQLVTAVDINNIGVAPSGFATQVKVYSSELTPSVVTANLCAEQSFTVTGLASTDKVFLNLDEEIAAESSSVSLVAARASDADTLGITFCNVSGANASPTSGTHVTTAVRS